MTSHYNVRANLEYTEGRIDVERDAFTRPKKHVEQDPGFFRAIQGYIKTAERDNVKAERIRRLK